GHLAPIRGPRPGGTLRLTYATGGRYGTGIGTIHRSRRHRLARCTACSERPGSSCDEEEADGGVGAEDPRQADEGTATQGDLAGEAQQAAARGRARAQGRPAQSM